MGHVATRKFCCCLPVRFGVICSALIGIGLGGLIMVLGWITVHRVAIHQITVTKTEEAALVITSLTFMIVSITSVFGLLGAAGRAHSLVKTYSYMILANAVLTLGVGIYFIWALFHRDQSVIDKCVGGTNGDIGEVKHWICDKGFGILRVGLIIVLVIIWIFQIMGCFITFDYLGQLSEELALDHREDDEKRSSTNSSIPTIVVPPKRKSFVLETQRPPMRTTYSQPAAYDATSESYDDPAPYNPHLYANAADGESWNAHPSTMQSARSPYPFSAMPNTPRKV